LCRPVRKIGRERKNVRKMIEQWDRGKETPSFNRERIRKWGPEIRVSKLMRVKKIKGKINRMGHSLTSKRDHLLCQEDPDAKRENGDEGKRPR